MIWICLGLLLLLPAVGCQRDPADDGSRTPGTATHPWELPEWNVALNQSQQDEEPADSYTPEDVVETPTLRGPSLSAQDLLDPALLPGQWLQACLVKDEIMRLISIEDMHVLEMQPNGHAAFELVIPRDQQRLEGSWRKAAPGQLGLSFNNEPEISFFSELYGENYLYTWSYDAQVGMWYVRIPADAGPQIAANRFDTSRGELQLTNVVGRSYSGIVQSQNQIDCRGLYLNGIMTMRWEDQKGNLGGFAVFTVDPDWQALDGVWWIDDYEAAPFGGAWTGTRMTAVPDEEVPQE